MGKYTTVIVNDTVEFPCAVAILEKIPLFNGKILVPGDDNTKGSNSHRNEVNIDVPFDVNFRHLTVIAKIVGGVNILPMIDLNSHSDVLTVLKTADYFGIPAETVSAGFSTWVENRKWIELWHPEYMYLVHSRNENVVDFRKFFRMHKKPFDSVVKAEKLPEVRADPVFYIEMLMFFKNYDLTTCFDENNEKVQQRIATLKSERDAIWRVFMINPHADFLTEYFKHVPTNYPIWDCSNISVVQAVEIGEMTIAPLDVARERFGEFTYKMLEKPLNTSVRKPFPAANVAFAGGSIAKILGINYNQKNARQSDVDLFVFGKNYEERSRVFEEVLDWFKTYDPVLRTSRTYYGMRGSVTTVYIKDVMRKFQIISVNSANPFEIIGRFDLSHIQWCIVDGKFLGTPEACKSMREKVTRFANTKRLVSNRLVKALHCGYHIYKEASIIENFIDITDLIAPVVDEKTGVKSQSLQLQKMIRELYGFWYPKTIPDMDPDEERQHILCQIEKDCSANLVTDDPIFVLNNITIGGNFDNDYESVLFSTFNIANIANHVLGRRITKVTLRSNKGIIRLNTCLLKVNGIVQNDNGIEIRAKPEDAAFTDFCNQLEGPVFRLYRNGGVTSHILNDAGELSLIVPKYKLDNQVVRGVSCLKSQRGQALNIEEDLKPGDEIQVLFSIEINMYPDYRAVKLNPSKFIKYVKYDLADIARARSESARIDNEIKAADIDDDSTCQIDYIDDDITVVVDK